MLVPMYRKKLGLPARRPILHKRIPMHRSKNGRLRLADRPSDYEILGIAPVEIAEFEDGQRIGTGRGCYEWWYFDAHLDNGATVVVVFYTKPNVRTRTVRSRQGSPSTSPCLTAAPS